MTMIVSMFENIAVFRVTATNPSLRNKEYVYMFQCALYVLIKTGLAFK